MSSHSTASPRGAHYQPPTGRMIVILVIFVVMGIFAIHGLSPTSSATSKSTTPTTQHKSPSTTTTTHSTVVPKSAVTVQVANGTSISGLAGTYTQKLLLLGWATLGRANGSHTAATIVYYHPGYLWAANEIESEIGVSASASHALLAKAAVPGVSGSTGDDVVVLLGPDVG